MLRYTRFIAPLLFLACVAFGQSSGDEDNLHHQLQSSAFGGGSLTDGSSLYWSLGEISTSTLISSGSTLAQGFWQVDVANSKPEVTSHAPAPLQITCFPNPLGSVLTVTWTDGTNLLFAYLYNFKGQLIETATAHGGVHYFDFAQRPTGTYLLRFDDKEGVPLQIFKLHKQ